MVEAVLAGSDDDQPEPCLFVGVVAARDVDGRRTVKTSPILRTACRPTPHIKNGARRAHPEKGFREGGPIPYDHTQNIG